MAPKRNNRGKNNNDQPECDTWASLTEELLSMVFFHVCLPDRLKCRSVCKWWFKVERDNPPPRKQLPWLMLSLSAGDLFHRFYSLSDSITYMVNLPERIWNSVCCGSCEDWLVFSNQQHGNLLINPLSRNSFDLPRNINLDSPESESVKKNPFFIKKIILSWAPNPANHPFLAVIYGSIRSLCVSKVGHLFWSPEYFSEIEDILFSGRKLIAIDSEERVYEYELREDEEGNPTISSAKRYVIEEREDHDEEYYLDYVSHERYIYLVEACGKLFMIILIWYGDFAYEVTRIFKVYELDRRSIPFKWVWKGSLDGHAIFLSRSCSKALLASQYEGLREDLIYFSDDIRDMNLVYRDGHPSGDMKVFDMRNGRARRFMENRDNSSLCPPTWFFLSNNWYVR